MGSKWAHVAVILFLLLFLPSPFSKADSASPAPSPLHRLTIEQAIDGAITYLHNQQAQNSDEHGVRWFRGEWPSTMTLDRWVPKLGWRGKSAHDSNNFVTSSIAIILAQIYLDLEHTTSGLGIAENSGERSWQKIPQMIDLAVENILRYRHETDHTFGFWQRVPKRPAFWTALERQRAEDSGTLPLSRRANNFFFTTAFVNNAENVPDDADDTALSYALLFYHAKIHHREKSPFIADDFQIEKLYSAYRDVGRHGLRKLNLANLRSRGVHNTGAFLTWFADEKKMSFFPHTNKTYLPFGVNDVDCVVNSNILGTLNLYQKIDATEGVRESCEFLKRMVMTDKERVCGVYYPNWYTFYYSFIKMANICLKESGTNDQVKSHLTTKIKNLQAEEGYWRSYIVSDRVQSTALATVTLLREGKIDTWGTAESVERGIAYLLQEAKSVSEVNNKKSDQGIYWTGGIYFSGGTVVRKSVVWRSEAYTTALVLEALHLYKLYQQNRGDGENKNENTNKN